MGLEYFEAIGEAAFYGPKLDIQFRTAMGLEETMSTIQLDFLLPERFDLTYVGEDGITLTVQWLSTVGLFQLQNVS